MDTLPADNRFLHDTAHELEHEFSIEHATIQIEAADSEMLCHQSTHCAE
jgi:cobalt-zinc-cadmium efflux system protein